MLAIHHRPIANEASHIGGGRGEGVAFDGSVLLSVEKSSSFALVVFLWLIFTLMKESNQHLIKVEIIKLVNLADP